MIAANDSRGRSPKDFDTILEAWQAKREKQQKAGWIHSMCLKCFRKRWPHGKYSSWQVPVALRQWEVCCRPSESLL
jgi:hypothetical protein